MNYMLRARDTGQLNIDRVFARLFVIGGGIFWIAAFFAVQTKQMYSNLSYTFPEVQKAMVVALGPLALVIAVFVLGMLYERLTGILLVVVSIVMVFYGYFSHSTDGLVLWVTAFSVLVLPSLIAGALFELAARRQEHQEAEKKAAAPAE
jgi:hypothetical protein